jgi:hypothetical protein
MGAMSLEYEPTMVSIWNYSTGIYTDISVL